MAVFKCKMCGGELQIGAGATVAECEYCGTQQTLPRLSDDRKANLYDRANHFRRNNDFDKAMGIYEQLLNEDGTDAEAYWSLVLCRYGIEYVADPKTRKQIPTVNRAQFTSVFDDDNYKSALQYADLAQRQLYEAEARAINEIQKGILTISQKEEPFDVFICYKETDSNGRRTPDSVLATDLYHQLVREGFKVFFSRITLEDKLGAAYEPYIFAALNSAKVMVVLGTRPEYFQAVWVKNEWSRYLALIRQGQQKILIPAYRDMDPYDLPEEFSHLQAQDMSKLGFMQDLLYGIKKLVRAAVPQSGEVKETVIAANVNTAPLLERAFLFLEDGDWNSANEYCEKVLDQDPKTALAYLGKLMAELKVHKQEQLKDQDQPFDSKNNYQKAIRFGDGKLKATLASYIEHINTRNENARYEEAYRIANSKLQAAKTEQEYNYAAQLFRQISFYRDAAEKIIVCKEKIKEIKDKEEQVRQEKERQAALAREEKERRAAQARQKKEQKAERARQDKRRKTGQKKWTMAVAIAGVAVTAVLAFALLLFVIPISRYNAALGLIEEGKYDEAIAAFEALDGYKESETKIEECYTAIQYDVAVALMDAGNYTEAITAFEALGDYKDSKNKIDDCRTAKYTALLDEKYDAAIALMDAGQYSEALVLLQTFPSHKDSRENEQMCRYHIAISLMDEGKYWEALGTFEDLNDYQEAEKYACMCRKQGALREVISAGPLNTIALRENGAVVASGSNKFGQCDVSDWNDIIAVSAGRAHVVGLKSDGTVVAAGNNAYGQCDVSSWKDIIAISAGNNHTVGLRADGSVVAVGSNSQGQCDTHSWKNVVAISADGRYTMGLNTNGVIFIRGNGKGIQDHWQSENVVAIGVSDNGYGYCVLGVEENNSVYFTGSISGVLDPARSWKNVVAIDGSHEHIVGLKSDGTVVAVGDNTYGQCNVDSWKDIIAVSAGTYYTVGLKADGTVVAVGNNMDGQCDVDDWTGIKVPE